MKELNLFLTALEFYTRIPCSRWVNHSANRLNSATRYLPVIGWITGFVSAITFIASHYLFGTSLAVIFSMAASVLLTGAFHEDGFADFCDGFGGGWTKDKILLIMKDSRTGAYGVVGLVLILLTKFLALQQLVLLVQERPFAVIVMFVSAHSLSRFFAASFIFTHRYVRSEDSKAKPVAEGISGYTLTVAAVLALLPPAMGVTFTPIVVLVAQIFVLYLLKLYLGWYFTKWIGGYTGDCLGAAQQLSEMAVYLVYISIWKFT